MLPITFPQQNASFGKPKGWTDEQCTELAVWRGDAQIDEDGTSAPVIISCWKFSYEDLQEIQRTGVIWLSVTGTGMPPVSVFTENPFPDEDGG